MRIFVRVARPIASHPSKHKRRGHEFAPANTGPPYRATATWRCLRILPFIQSGAFLLNAQSSPTLRGAQGWHPHPPMLATSRAGRRCRSHAAMAPEAWPTRSHT
jgi:hypothetical protein